MSHANILASSIPSGAYVQRYLHYTVPSLLVLHVNSITIGKISVSYWVLSLDINFLRWWGGGGGGEGAASGAGSSATGSSSSLSSSSAFFPVGWRSICTSGVADGLLFCGSSAVEATRFQPVEVNNLSFLSPLKAFDFVVALAQAFNDFQRPFPGVGVTFCIDRPRGIAGDWFRDRRNEPPIIICKS